MGNQNCTQNCQGISENKQILDNIASQLIKIKKEEDVEEIIKVKSSKPGNWEKMGI